MLPRLPSSQWARYSRSGRRAHGVRLSCCSLWRRARAFRWARASLAVGAVTEWYHQTID
jgi:hypothetical protein